MLIILDFVEKSFGRGEVRLFQEVPDVERVGNAALGAVKRVTAHLALPLDTLQIIESAGKHQGVHFVAGHLGPGQGVHDVHGDERLRF